MATDEETRETMDETLLFYEAVMADEKQQITYLLDDEAVDVDSILSTVCPTEGYTALHLACLKDSGLAELLITDYNANVNVVADDGGQPIHLACLSNMPDIVGLLLERGADVNAPFSEKVLTIYSKQWMRSCFNDDAITPLTYAVLYNKIDLVKVLVKYNPNFGIKSFTNKTLLMYALQRGNLDAAIWMLPKLKDSLVVNSRDDNDMHAFHYLLHKNKFKNFRNHGTKKCTIYWELSRVTRYLIKAGANVYATIKGNSDTMILNTAAHAGCIDILQEVLPCYTSIDKSKALRNAARKVEYSEVFYSTYEIEEGWNFWIQFKYQRESCIKMILKDLVTRQAFGLDVPREEDQMMEELMATDEGMKNVVHNFKQNFIQQLSNQDVFKGIEIGQQKISLEEFARKVFGNEFLRRLMKDEKLFGEVQKYLRYYTETIYPRVADTPNYGDEDSDIWYFDTLLASRIENLRRKKKLREECRKISRLREFIPLPYEIILEVFDFLNNWDLILFIHAFNFELQN